MSETGNRRLSVIMNTDGVVTFKSTKSSLWPVLLMINELPFSERYFLYASEFITDQQLHRKLPKNMILAGLWYGGEKPSMQLFLKPIIEELSELETTGFIIIVTISFYLSLSRS